MMQPAMFMTDYEDGMRLAVRKFWPNIVLRGCWYHLCRAVNRRANKTGLAKILMTNDKAKAITSGLMKLPLLPTDKIEEGFACVQQFARKNKLQKRFSPLLEYFERYWLRNQVKITFT